MIPASERAKTVHALDRWATVTSHYSDYLHLFGSDHLLLAVPN
jgi:hypothetical protein